MNSQTSSIIVQDNPQHLEHVRCIKLNRPHKRNAIDLKTAQALAGALSQAEHDPKVRAIILSGEGDKVFCAGADLQGFLKQKRAGISKITALFGKIFLQMHQMGTPVIAAVNGIAVGGGFGLMLSSDLVVLSSEATIGTPEVKRGLFPAIISRMIYEQLPAKFANELIMTGELIIPEKALKLGLCNEIVPPEQVLQQALLLAGKLASYSGSVMSLGKKAVLKQKDMSFEDAIMFLQEVLAQNIALDDTREGMMAFMEKRKPNW